VLVENTNVRQEPAAGRRRWFDGDRLELVVWHDAVGAVSGFQLCYGLPDGERALTWRPGGGFAHNAVDTGDATPFKNETPVLVADGEVPWAELEQRFRAEGTRLEPALRELIAARLAARG
jgi:hypothetical protein